MQNFIANWGYLAVFVLTVLESACVPIPSEVTLGFAGALASGAVVAGSHNHLNLGLVILAGIAGSLVGSLIAYVFGRTGARRLVDRYGKYVLVSHKDLDRAENWFKKYGDPVVLFGRVIPLIRTFVSVPAGMAEMPVAKFILFSAIGVAVWVSALTSAGYALGANYHALTKDIGLAGYVLAGIAIIAIAVVIVWRYRAAKARRAGTGPRHAATSGTTAESEFVGIPGPEPATGAEASQAG